VKICAPGVLETSKNLVSQIIERRRRGRKRKKKKKKLEGGKKE
jgi:hypothetical protein